MSWTPGKVRVTARREGPLPMARGQDVKIELVDGRDGQAYDVTKLVPVKSVVIRCGGRDQYVTATVEFENVELDVEARMLIAGEPT